MYTENKSTRPAQTFWLCLLQWAGSKLVTFHHLLKQGRSSCNQLNLLANLCETVKLQGYCRQNNQSKD
uniref:Uncharacterized protein n=1 Tax=Anguilla anguilla TaxID=7936 RepID=A0A0E9PSV4_ANGAN